MTEPLHAGGITQVKAYRVLQAHVSETIKSHGLGSVSEWFVLSYVCHTKQIMAKDLAALLEVEAPLITRLSNNLRKSGLVTISQDATDKRVKYLIPTERAHLLVPIIEAELETVLTGLLRGTTLTELKAYQKVLTTIIHNGENMNKDNETSNQ